LNSTLGTKFEIVAGYRSIPDQFLAVQKGEVGGACQAYISTLLRTQRHLLEGSDPVVKPILFIGQQLPPEKIMQGVPTIDSISDTPTARALFRVIQLMGVISYPYAVAPGVPEDRVAALREGFQRTLADPEFVSEATRTGMLIVPNSGADVTRYVNQMIHAPPDVIGELKRVLGPR
jgi:hypothetical protein